MSDEQRVVVDPRLDDEDAEDSAEIRAVEPPEKSWLQAGREDKEDTNESKLLD